MMAEDLYAWIVRVYREGRAARELEALALRLAGHLEDDPCPLEGEP